MTADEVVDALVVLAPVIGRTRVMAVAPKVALATGFDVAAALEALTWARPVACPVAGWCRQLRS